MKEPNATTELRASIKILEAKQELAGKELKEQLKTTYQSMKPANLIRNTINQLTTPEFTEDILTTALSLGAGFISKKLAVGNGSSRSRQLLGTLLQVGITSLISKNAGSIVSLLGTLIKPLIKPEKPKEEAKPSESVQ